MAQQTAVEWLVKELNQELDYIPIKQWDRIRDLVEQAKAMEKKQIKDAFVECWKANVPDGIECKLDAEQYYTETYEE